MPVVRLLFSNIVMTLAWYGRLSYKSAPLWIVMLVSWGIAFDEHCLLKALPGRTGQPLGLHHAIGFAPITAGAFFIFQGKI